MSKRCLKPMLKAWSCANRLLAACVKQTGFRELSAHRRADTPLLRALAMIDLWVKVVLKHVPSTVSSRSSVISL